MSYDLNYLSAGPSIGKSTHQCQRTLATLTPVSQTVVIIIPNPSTDTILSHVVAHRVAECGASVCTFGRSREGAFGTAATGINTLHQFLGCGRVKQSKTGKEERAWQSYI
eukprot:scaffold34658_cov230-Amphora_coffeaeformis.AAC.2